MSLKSISILKNYFLNGKRPPQENFFDLIDSFIHKDGAITIGQITDLQTYIDKLGSLQIADIENLQTVLNNLASIEIDDVTGLRAVLDALAVIGIEEVTGLQTALDAVTNSINNVANSLTNYVQKETGKGLSSNDFSTGYINTIQSLVDNVTLLNSFTYITIVTDATTARVITADDLRKRIIFTNASPIALTIATQAVQPITLGTKIEATVKGNGAVTISGAGVELIGNTLTFPKGETFTLVKVGPDSWTIEGNAPAVDNLEKIKNITASYTFVLTDANKTVVLKAPSLDLTTTITVPTNDVVAFPIGTKIILRQEGARGYYNRISGAGITFLGQQTASTLGIIYFQVNHVLYLTKVDTNIWVIERNSPIWFNGNTYESSDLYFSGTIYAGSTNTSDLTTAGNTRFSTYPNTRNDGQIPTNRVLGTDASGDLKIYSIATAPAPYLDVLVPDSTLPSTTTNFTLKGAFFTPKMTVVIEGQTVNYITFKSDNLVLVNVTTGAAEGSYSVTLNNGISAVFPNALLIVLGTVFTPTPANWIDIAQPINIDEGSSALVKTPNSTGSANLNYTLNKAKRFSIYFNTKETPFSNTFPTNWNGYPSIKFIDLVNGDVTKLFDRYGYNEFFIKKNTTDLGAIGWSGAVQTSKNFRFYWDMTQMFVYLNGALIYTFAVGFFPNDIKVGFEVYLLDNKNIKYVEHN